MASEDTILRIFLASPGDVAAERMAARASVDELNINLPDSHGIRLEVIGWDTHAAPGAGEDAQDVINKQIPDDFDIFVGVMWARLGTPTGRADSGTEEEFERAFKRRGDGPGQVQIMMYFKDAPLSPSAIDPAQLGALQSFKKKLSASGLLTWKFAATEDFGRLLRIHLTKRVIEFSKRQATVQAAPKFSEVYKKRAMQLMDEANAKAAVFTAVADRIADLAAVMRASTDKATLEIESLPEDQRRSAFVARFTPIIDAFARGLDAEVGPAGAAITESIKLVTDSAMMMNRANDAEAQNHLASVVHSFDETIQTLDKVSDHLATRRDMLAVYVGTDERLTPSLTRLIESQAAFDQRLRSAVDAMHEGVALLQSV